MNKQKRTTSATNEINTLIVNGLLGACRAKNRATAMHPSCTQLGIWFSFCV